MKTSEIRTSFLNYFKEKGHTIAASSSLIPAGDPTLLFVNAGMVQFKDCFLGTEKRGYTRATTAQKCLRISGKHNDLENVGRTARHHTFFEMLGNFSFGDYFKEDAIKFAWEFLTVRLQLPKERLWVTVFEKDDEAAELWRKHTDVMEGRILRCGEKDNFWAMGDTGPCGPCTEIHYYLGDDLNIQSEDDFRKEDGRYMEIWNLVFMQFNRDPSGALAPLPKPSVDTGMGLERIAAVKQGVCANYDIDLLRQIISFTEEMSGKKYDGRDYTERDANTDHQYAVDVAMRVICDHVRSSVFLVADGILPSSDGRGYVLRRLIRRACRHGRNIGFHKAFLFKVAQKVVELMGDVYPEIVREKDKITQAIKQEEEKFIETLDTGIRYLEKSIADITAQGVKIIPGKVAFKLHDTYGFPLDMTEDIVRGHGLIVDHDGFETAMEEQRERSRSARASETELILQRAVKPLPCVFVGYQYLEYESEVLGIFNEQGEVASAQAGEQVAVVVAETPFYAECGGQVGDTGSLSSNNAALEVIDTQKVGGDTIVHLCSVVDGLLSTGDKVRLCVDKERRRRIAANHSATHLVHLALREVLGTHVKQSGSRVSEHGFRFDFNHSKPVSAKELEEIEAIINHEVLLNHKVTTEILPIEQARNSGAMALFDEKYGQEVRVVQVCPQSKELCGGTHADRSGDLGLVNIVSESSISSGVRRIEGVAGYSALQRINSLKALLSGALSVLNTNERDLLERLSKVLDKNKELEKEIIRLTSSMGNQKVGDLTQQARLLADGTQVVASVVDNASIQQLKDAADNVRAKLGKACVLLGSVIDGKVVFLAAVTDNLTDKYHAGNIIKEISKVTGGRGGGKADFAQAGGGDPEKLESALRRFEELVA